MLPVKPLELLIDVRQMQKKVSGTIFDNGLDAGNEGEARLALVVAGRVLRNPVGHGPTSTLRSRRYSAACGSAGKGSDPL